MQLVSDIQSESLSAFFLLFFRRLDFLFLCFSIFLINSGIDGRVDQTKEEKQKKEEKKDVKKDEKKANGVTEEKK